MMMVVLENVLLINQKKGQVNNKLDNWSKGWVKWFKNRQKGRQYMNCRFCESESGEDVLVKIETYLKATMSRF